jgi:glycosyltransferase involved in cell wall biosynthesis
MAVTTVDVLLSTFNGERFLADQLDSILCQDGVDVRLTIRDDGSTDGTRDLLARYAADDRVRLILDNNLGLPAAYFRLLDLAPSDGEYFALADQDDIWLPHKLRRAVDHLAEHSSQSSDPAMYCARVQLVDEQDRDIQLKELPRRPLDFANALTQNMATGCTIVFNSAARRILIGRWPESAVMHDAWIYLVVSGTGTVVYDPEVTVRYRQHGGNVVGIGRTALRRFAGRVARQLAPGGAGAHGRQNAQLADTHAGLLHADAQAALDDFLECRASIKKRAWYALHGSAHRQTRGSDVIFRVLYLLRRA